MIWECSSWALMSPGKWKKISWKFPGNLLEIELKKSVATLYYPRDTSYLNIPHTYSTLLNIVSIHT